MRACWACCAFLLLSSSARADVELKNDGFVSGVDAGFMAGFDANEAAASRFVSPDATRQVTRVQLLYGGASGTRTVTLKIWDDTDGTNVPGSELFSQDFTVTGSDSAITELPVSPNVPVPMQFRVGVVFHDMGLPCVAQDKDMTIAADKNYILVNGTSWVPSSSLGVTGDWILRAFVTGDPVGGGDSGVTPTSCTTNTECPTGQYCDLPTHACTFDCQTNSDCGDGTCNSLGKCVGGSGGGCCNTDGGRHSGGLLLGVGIVLLLGRRRR